MARTHLTRRRFLGTAFAGVAAAGALSSDAVRGGGLFGLCQADDEGSVAFRPRLL